MTLPNDDYRQSPMRYGDHGPDQSLAFVPMLIVVGLTALIAWRTGQSLFGAAVPRSLVLLLAPLIAASATYTLAPVFITNGLPAILADRAPNGPSVELVEVTTVAPFCPAGRSIEIDGALVRNERLGGPGGVPICRIPHAVARGLRPGSRLRLHGHLGAYGFHYDRISR